MALSTWVAYITIVGVILALLGLTRNRIQNWATRRAVFHLKFWSWQHIPVSPASAVTRRRRALLYWQRLRHDATLYLVPIQYRVALIQLEQKVDEELDRDRFGGQYFPSPDSNPLYVEIAAYINYKENRLNERDSLRRHRGVRCAGCGIKYGKKRKDHDFAGGGGVRGSGGWFCKWINSNGMEGSCIPTATGDHYCGMCERERREEEPTDEAV